MCDLYFKEYILKGDKKRQKRLIGYIDKLRTTNSSGSLKPVLQASNSKASGVNPVPLSRLGKLLFNSQKKAGGQYFFLLKMRVIMIQEKAEAKAEGRVEVESEEDVETNVETKCDS